MIRPPVLADRAQIRVILRQNITLMERETLAGMTAARVQAILDQFVVRVHIDDATQVLDSVWAVNVGPLVWEVKIAFVLAGIGQARFRRIWIECLTEFFGRAQAAGLAMCSGAMTAPLAVGVQLVVDEATAAGGWDVDLTTRPGFAIYSMTPAQGLLGIAAVVP